MFKSWLLLSISLIASFYSLAQTNTFQTSHGQTIHIRNDGIYKWEEFAGVTYGPSAPMRFELLFDHDKLFSIIHLRKLGYKYASPIILNRSFFLTVTGNPSEEKVKNFVQQFNEMINKGD